MSKIHVTASSNGVGIGARTLCGALDVDASNVDTVKLVHVSYGAVALYALSGRIKVPVCESCGRSLAKRGAS